MIKKQLDYIIVHNALYLISVKSLIISDIHLGYDESIKNEGVLIPLVSSRKLLKNLVHVIKELESDEYEVKNIIFNGDIKHEFGTVLRFESKTFKELFRMSRKYKLYFILGNHDKILREYFKQFDPNPNILLCNSVFIDDKYFIVHGDNSLKDFELDSLCIGKCKSKEIKEKIIIIGHEHPVIAISDGARTEKFKAIIMSKKLIILPSFNPLIHGVDFNYQLRQGKFLSPVLNESKVKDYSAYLFDDDVNSEFFYFNSIKKLF